MRYLMIAALLSGIGANVTAKAAEGAKKELKDSLSYAIGMDVGGNLKELNIDLPTFYRGLEDIMKGKTPLLTEEQAKEIKTANFKRINEEQGAKAEKEGEEFLEKNAKKPGVTETPSGLQYIVVKAGTGARPTREDKAKVNYIGTLVDGTEFDNSYKRGEPVEFPVAGVIPGWTEALQLMNVGGKYKLFVPADLAYGERRMGQKIPPNSTLIFEVELLDVIKDSSPAAKPDPLKGLRLK